MRTTLSTIGPLIAALGFLPYLNEIAKGNVCPRIASWATWSLVTGVATVAGLSQHAYTSASLTGMATCLELSILVMALRCGDHDYSWVDGASLVISIAGIAGWLTSNNPSWSIIFNVVADFFGAVPTFYHLWVSPHQESWMPFVLSGIGSGVSVLAIKDIGVVSAGFPIYLCSVGLALGFGTYFRQKVVPKPCSKGNEGCSLELRH